jgi:hypothetical protein
VQWSSESKWWTGQVRASGGLVKGEQVVDCVCVCLCADVRREPVDAYFKIHFKFFFSLRAR